MKSSNLRLALLLLLSNCSAFAQTTWTDGGNDSSWINDINWSNSAPTSSSAVTFASPISLIGVDTGGPTTVASITVNSGTSAFSLIPAGGETLIVNGNFINNSANTVDINLGFTVGGIATLDGPINFNSSVNVDLRTATIAGAINLNSTLVFQLNNTTGSGYGRFIVGSGAALAFNGANNSITFASISSYTGANGNVFNLVSNSGGTITGLASSLFDVSTLPTLTGGLTWNTSALNVGTLSVVPEPKTWLMLALGLTVIVVFRRRQKA